MQEKKKVILGFTGLIACGKGTSAEYLNDKYGATTYRFSTMLRDLLDRIYVSHTRDNMIKMSEFVRETYGEDIMAKTMAKDVENDKNSIIVVEGIRRQADIEYLSKNPDFVLVSIEVDPETRYSRLVKRGENEDDKTKTYEQFLEDHKRSTEMSIPPVMEKASEVVDNNESLEQLNDKLDKLMEKYTN